MNTIYSIISTNNGTPVIHEISDSKLGTDYLASTHPDDSKQFVVSEIKLYTLFTTFDNKIMVIKKYYNEYEPNNLYAFNKITTFGIEPALVDITGFNIEDVRKMKIFKNNISQTPVEVNAFYEDGIVIN
jgi:hypothetical protein